MDHRLVDRVDRLVREDARRKARDELLDAALVALLHDVVLHCDVFAPKVDLVRHVGKQAPYFTGQVEDVRRVDSVKQGMCFLCVCKIGILGSGEEKRPARDGLGIDSFADSIADEASASRDEHDGSFGFGNGFASCVEFSLF